MEQKILIIGGVAGGATTAARLRRLNENATIIIFERDDYISFANCGLPYYIGGVITNRDQLLLQSPASFNARFNVDVRVHSEVTAVNTVTKTLTITERSGKTYTETYTQLVLSPGAKPLMPPIPGINSDRIFILRNVADTDRIKNHITTQNPKNAIVIGAGFIGIEMLENLVELGIETTLIEAAPQVLAPFDSEMARIIEHDLIKHGVNVLVNEKAVSFTQTDSDISVTLESGATHHASMIILAIGVQPDTKFLQNSGIDMDPRGYIKTNAQMQTNHPDVFALGDAVLVHEIVGGKTIPIPLAGPANRQGRIVANNLNGAKESYLGALGTSILKVFDMTVSATGNNERTLKAASTPYQAIYIHPNSHAGYYPGATPLTIKVLYNPTNGQVLGAQALGYEGVDKFIDVVATTIKFKGTMEDLSELELAYAPPYSSAKSPANMAGFVGRNIMDGLMPVAQFDEALNLKADQLLLDVRDASEVQAATLPNSIHIAVNELRHGKDLNKLDKNKEILVYCAVGVRGYIATRYLLSQGYKARNVLGGMRIKPGFTALAPVEGKKKN
jgi:NADPH-dependent 2,4-dienoyl-CoA reductase/sulfur reductase-like enzyme/rhodanese-related sulfurtransferase